MKRFGRFGCFNVIALVIALLTGSSYVAISPPQASAASEMAGPQDPKEVEQFADEFFNRPEIKENMAGAAFAVVKGDKVLVNKGYGYADVKKKLPVDPERTVFRVASISKVITATAVMQLAEQGKLGLDEDLSAYLGDARIPNQTNAPLAMKHLLTNSTGFDYGDTPESTTTDLARDASLKQYVMDNLPTVIRKPGEYYRYDNLGFTIQGYVIEEVTGKSFGAYVQDHIFKPLGMANSDFRLTPQMVKQLAVPYNLIDEAIPTYATIPTELPGGGMLSTSSDMAKFMMAHLNGGKHGNATILKQETVADMHAPKLAIHEKLPNMAYGFEYSNQQNYKGRYIIEKAGDLEGFHSGMWLIPDEKVGLFVTVNKDFEIRQPLFEAFMDHYYPGEDEPKEPIGPSKQSLAKFEGIYSDLRNRMWTSRIHVEGSKLIVKDPLGEHVLNEIEPLLFQDEQGVKAAFKLNETGNVAAFYYDLKSDSWGVKMPEPQRYQDVGLDHPYAPYIYHLRQLDVIREEGSEQRFAPEQPITKEQFMGWFIRWTGIAPSKQKPVFTDISGSPYAKEIQAAYELGLLQVPADGKFHPEAFMTRQEAATIVWRMAFGYLHAEPQKANLSGKTDSWALDGVHYVVEKGLHGPEVSKDRDGGINYQSDQPMLRQEAAALLSQFADKLL